MNQIAPVVLPSIVFALALGAATTTPLRAQQVPSQAPGAAGFHSGQQAADENAMWRAGYVSLGPFAIGSSYDSNDIAGLLPKEPLVWIETAHFRIGCSLAPIAVAGSREWVASVREELARLARKLPTLKPDVASLDGWLRAHLIAQRVEDTYAQVLSNLGLDDGCFPAVPGDDARRAQQFRGLGPYLGMPKKFTILLMRESTSLSRYTAAYHSWATSRPVRYHDHTFGSAFFGACEQSDDGLLRNDHALRTHLAFHVAHNLYTSYRSYGHNLPAWIITGLAYWHARQVSTQFPIYDLRTAENADGKHYATWVKRATTRLRARTFEPLVLFLERMDVDSYSMDDHHQCWALVDWLMTHHEQATMRFLHRMKEPFHERLRFPTPEELMARQRSALVAALGVDAAGLEDLWRRQSNVVAKR